MLNIIYDIIDITIYHRVSYFYAAPIEFELKTLTDNYDKPSIYYRLLLRFYVEVIHIYIRIKNSSEEEQFLVKIIFDQFSIRFHNLIVRKKDKVFLRFISRFESVSRHYREVASDCQ